MATAPASERYDVYSEVFVDEMAQELWETSATLQQEVEDHPTAHWDELSPEDARHWRRLARAALAYLHLNAIP